MKHTITLRIYISELLYDVQQRAYTLGNSLKTSDNPALSALIQEAVDENENTLLRSFDQSFATLRDELGEYLISEKHEADNVLLDKNIKIINGLTFGYAGAPSANAESTVDNTLVLMLRMPTNFAMDSRESLAKNIHAYIVDCALADWLSLTPARELAQQYTQSAASDLLLIKQAVNRRQRPNRVHAPSAEEPHTNDIRYE